MTHHLTILISLFFKKKERGNVPPFPSRCEPMYPLDVETSGNAPKETRDTSLTNHGALLLNAAHGGSDEHAGCL